MFTYGSSGTATLTAYVICGREDSNLQGLAPSGT